MANSLAKLLKDRRKQLKLTLVKAAERTKLEQSYICRVELGKRNPSKLETLQKFAEGYRISLSRLQKAAAEQ